MTKEFTNRIHRTEPDSKLPIVALRDLAVVTFEEEIRIIPVEDAQFPFVVKVPYCLIWEIDRRLNLPLICHESSPSKRQLVDLYSVVFGGSGHEADRRAGAEMVLCARSKSNASGLHSTRIPGLWR